MGYELDAILAKRSDAACFKLKAALFFPLTDELTLIPNTDDLRQDIKSLQDWAREASKGTMIAHLAAEFFGGMGGHSCTLWTNGTSESELDINHVLDRFGVKCSEAHDQFDAVELGRCRKTEGWAALAVIEPICKSAEALVKALNYNCADKAVQERVHSSAAFYLGKLKAVNALGALKDALNDNEYGTRLSAACALADIGEPAVATLIEALNGRDTWNIVYALTKVGPVAPAVPHINRLLRHEDWKIRLQAIEALVSIGSVGSNISALLNDPDKLVRNAARKALE